LAFILAFSVYFVGLLTLYCKSAKRQLHFSKVDVDDSFYISVWVEAFVKGQEVKSFVSL
jgi:hypothetical protein